MLYILIRVCYNIIVEGKEVINMERLIQELKNLREAVVMLTEVIEELMNKF